MSGSFDPATLAILRAAFDDACSALREADRTPDMRATIAERILKLGAAGERDPVQLRIGALTGQLPVGPTVEPHRSNPLIASEVRDFTDRSMEQARKAFHQYIELTRNTDPSFQAQGLAVGGQDILERTTAFAQQNVDASFAFAQKLVRAKNIQEMMQLQAEFVVTQMQALSEQGRQLGDTALRTFSREAKPVAPQTEAQAEGKSEKRQGRRDHRS